MAEVNKAIEREHHVTPTLYDILSDLDGAVMWWPDSHLPSTWAVRRKPIHHNYLYLHRTLMVQTSFLRRKFSSVSVPKCHSSDPHWFRWCHQRQWRYPCLGKQRRETRPPPKRSAIKANVNLKLSKNHFKRSKVSFPPDWNQVLWIHFLTGGHSSRSRENSGSDLPQHSWIVRRSEKL